MKNKTGDKLYQIAILVLLLFAAMEAFFLVYTGMCYSYISPTDYNQNIYLVKDAAWVQVCIILTAVVSFVVLNRLFMRCDEGSRETICRGVLGFTCAAALIAGIGYVLCNPYYPVGDQINTTAFAAYARSGDYSMLVPSGYIGMYPFQKRLAFLYELIFSVFGDFNYTAAKIIHVFWWVTAILAGYGFLRQNSMRAICRPVYCVFMLLCVPYFLYLPYIYGDVLSTSFCIVLFWALSAYEHTGKKRYVAIGVFTTAISLMARTNTLIILIAVGIYVILLCFKKRNVRALAVGAVILAVSFGSVKTVDFMYEVRSGISDDTGIPSILWVAMGLQETDGRYGVYNRYQQTTFEENDFLADSAAEEGWDYTWERLGEFLDQPSLAWDFFRNKLIQQWTEPMFEGLVSTCSFDDSEVPEFIWSIYYGNLHNVIAGFANGYQSIVYFAVLCYVLADIRAYVKSGSKGEQCERPISVWLPMIAMVGGFLFSILWEAQCRYVMPYYVFSLLYVPEGLGAAAQCVEKVIKDKRSKKD